MSATPRGRRRSREAEEMLACVFADLLWRIGNRTHAVPAVPWAQVPRSRLNKLFYRLKGVRLCISADLAGKASRSIRRLAGARTAACLLLASGAVTVVTRLLQESSLRRGTSARTAGRLFSQMVSSDYDPIDRRTTSPSGRLAPRAWLSRSAS